MASESKKEPPKHQPEQPGREYCMHPKPVIIKKSYKGSEKLEGKVALITGGDSGIGRAVAVHFAREGADIAIVYLNEHKDAEDTAAMVRNEGKKCLTIAGDCQSSSFCRTAIEQVISKLGKLDILVNGIAEQHPKDHIEEISDEQLIQTFSTNIFGYFFMIQSALKHMKKSGNIINTGSVTSFRGSDHLIDYSCTKGAIQALTFSLANSLAEKGIRVNGVAPGPIWTPLIPASFNQKELDNFGKNTLMKRAGEPAEVAPAYVYLACEDASYVTGQFIHVNGGDYMAI